MPKSTSVDESVTTTGLLGALPIAESAITSRVVVNNPLVRVVMFAFGEGELLTEHTSPRAVVVQLLSGRLDFTLDGEKSVMEPGDIIYMRPGARHALVALEPSHMSLVMVDTEPAAASRAESPG